MDVLVFIIDALLTPEERPSFYALLIVIAGYLMIFRQTKASMSLISITFITMFMGAPIVEKTINAFLDQLPAYIFWPLMAVMVYGFVAWVMSRLMGEEKGKEVTNEGLFWLIKQTLLAPLLIRH